VHFAGTLEPVRPAGSVDEILSDPIDRYLAGRSFVVWFQPRLAGAFGFGRLDPADEPQLSQLLVTPVLPAGYDLLCDFGAVEQLDERAFALLGGFLDGHPELVKALGKFAFVRPPGLAGAGLTGLFYEKVDPIACANLFADRSEALDWLGYAPSAPQRHDIDELVATVDALSPTLRRLRVHLFRDVGIATLDQAASALGTSSRSLQRELAAAGTSFRAELARTRVRIAESLLTNTDDKIESIAHRTGFASVSAFTVAFTRAVGETPHEFRRRRR